MESHCVDRMRECVDSMFDPFDAFNEQLDMVRLRLCQASQFQPSEAGSVLSVVTGEAI